MKLEIERTMFWFNKEEDIVELNHKFYFLGNLLNRLLSDNYNGKKLKFLNIELYDSPHRLQKAYGKDQFLHYYGGQLTYKKVIDLEYFLNLNFNEQKLFIWELGYKMLQYAGKELKNESLVYASEYAYRRGLELQLIADYSMIDSNVVLFDEKYKASIWVNFLEDKMQANFILEKNHKIIFEKIISDRPNGMEFFLVMFKKIEQKGNTIIIKGAKDVDFLPLKIIFNTNLKEIN